MQEKANLFLNGDLDLEWLKNINLSSPIYCADGAFIKIKKLFPNIVAVIGDLDSLENTNLVDVELVKVSDQNYTDFEKALEHLLDKFEEIDVYGATGGQLDHFMGNLSVAKKYKDKVNIVFIEPEQYFFFMKGNTSLNNVLNKTISILPFPKIENIKSKGLLFELDHTSLELGDIISVRNKAVSDQIEITFESGCAIMFVNN
ncbi:thiamine diphosphokinase [Candidatus Peregrinibacteria bacterium]|jgi:thiamine pyrophosphokinase|nr:thiamine diphosphokinase [Candidatus Peregrinibacteria bacterium]MBT3598990.1 thiamine diphosphokinase [Candidatus Peregrinibacteria bacterium]MBT4366978.1 thiamine diphosphokinase [Candidatus Peregrinibacteria bacterium]MBT4585484.1 thiamine diphosphokinase [Candidatus Peregrinibacteria bacterium]MBT6731299.1 thiamine diphosphokinase [Candidatus Peregrinibacteria bacterium]